VRELSAKRIAAMDRIAARMQTEICERAAAALGETRQGNRNYGEMKVVN
jgi:hypothetical protein